MYKGGNHMEQTKKLLEAREKYLLQIKNEKEQALTEVPEGTLRLCTHEKTHNIIIEKTLKILMVSILEKRIFDLHKDWHKKIMTGKFLVLLKKN